MHNILDYSMAEMKVEIQQPTKNLVGNKTRKKRTKKLDIYAPVMITKRVPIPIINVGNNIKQTLERMVAHLIEGRCIVEGYVKPGSVKVETYSSGMLSSSDVVYDVIVRCLVCSPVEGMHIDCIAKSITESAGIKAEVDETPSPIIVYVARDHHFSNKSFSKVSVGDNIKVRVIGQRFELNDTYISVIAELIEDKGAKYKTTKKRNLKIKS